jgi:hypothetical protein
VKLAPAVNLNVAPAVTANVAVAFRRLASRRWARVAPGVTVNVALGSECRFTADRRR